MTNTSIFSLDECLVDAKFLMKYDPHKGFTTVCTSKDLTKGKQWTTTQEAWFNYFHAKMLLHFAIIRLVKIIGSEEVVEDVSALIASCHNKQTSPSEPPADTA